MNFSKRYKLYETLGKEKFRCPLPPEVGSTYLVCPTDYGLLSVLQKPGEETVQSTIQVKNILYIAEGFDFRLCENYTFHTAVMIFLSYVTRIKIFSRGETHGS